MIQHHPDADWTLVTGATGLVGHYVLAGLLGRDRRCLVLLRSPVERSANRLRHLLADLGVDLDHELATGRVLLVPGALGDGATLTVPLPPARIVHCAGSTRFDAHADGEPTRTNVRGTRELLDVARGLGTRELHFVSTAFACGTCDGVVPERHHRRPTAFRNDYEQSKWEAEAAAVAWADASRASLTIYRPSIVVGEHATGRCTKFTGIYLPFRAADALRRLTDQEDTTGSRRIPLRMEGCPEARHDIVPVEHVARVIAAVIADPDRHGRVYHIVHPDPPRGALVQQAVEAELDIGGGRFVDRAALEAEPLNDYERAYHDIIEPVRPYLVRPPRFDRSNTDGVETTLGIRCPEWDLPALRRLIRYGREHQWGRTRRRAAKAAPSPNDACAAYFEQFLPSRIRASVVARVAGLTTTVRFIIEDVPDGQWVCRFVDGRLEEVSRGWNGLREEYSYRTRESAFWRIVTGEADPQQVFLDGEAEIRGDVEKALKLGVVLRAFNQEQPCRREDLVAARNPEHA